MCYAMTALRLRLQREGDGCLLARYAVLRRRLGSLYGVLVDEVRAEAAPVGFFGDDDWCLQVTEGQTYSRASSSREMSTSSNSIPALLRAFWVALHCIQAGLV